MVAFVRKIEKNTKLKGSVKYVRFVFMFSYHGIDSYECSIIVFHLF